MGVSNSEMFLSAEKDLNALELNFLTRPKLEFQDHDCHNNNNNNIIATLQNGTELSVKPEDVKDQEDETDKEEDHDKRKVLASSLRVQVPCLGEFKVEEDSADGFKTPTSLDHKIPVVLQCPPAPRKPKSRPLIKRKVSHQRRILHDLSNEIEALFPPALRADLGKKIKKVRQESTVAN